MEANSINLDLDLALSSLTWVHIVSNIGYINTSADEGADDNCRELRDKY